MGRLFNQVVFDDDISGTTPTYISSELNELLGRADELAIQVTVTRSGGTSPDITVIYQGCNNGRFWEDISTLISAASLATTPYNDISEVRATTLPALGRLKITLGGTSPEARVQITVCGRSN